MKPTWMRLPWLEMKFFKFLKVFPKSPTVTVFFKRLFGSTPRLFDPQVSPLSNLIRTRRKRVLWSECLAATHRNILTLSRGNASSTFQNPNAKTSITSTEFVYNLAMKLQMSTRKRHLSVLWTYSLWKLLTKTYPTENIVFLLRNRSALDRGFREEF